MSYEYFFFFFEATISGLPFSTFSLFPCGYYSFSGIFSNNVIHLEFSGVGIFAIISSASLRDYEELYKVNFSLKTIASV